MKLKFVFTFCALIALSFQSVRGDGIGDLLAPGGNSTTAQVTGTPHEQEHRNGPAPAENAVPPAPKDVTPADVGSFEEWMGLSTWGQDTPQANGEVNTSGDTGSAGTSGVPGAQWRITNIYDWDNANSPDHAKLKNHDANNDDAWRIAKDAGKICGHLNADKGPDYEKCRRNVIHYNGDYEDAKDEKGLLPRLAKAKADYVGVMGQSGVSPKDTMELGSKFDAVMGVVMMTRAGRADKQQEENTKAAKENRIMAIQNEDQIIAVNTWNKDSQNKNDQRAVTVAPIHAEKFRNLANEADTEAANWDGKDSEATWAGLATLGMAYFQHDLARKFDRDAEGKITDPVGQVQPGGGLQPFTQNNPQPIPQPEYFGEEQQDPEASGYDKTGANPGSGDAASTGKLGLSQLAPSMPEREDTKDTNSPLDPNMGLNRYSSGDGADGSGNDDIKKYLDSVFGKKQGGESAGSHKSTDFGNADENLAKVKALGKNEDIFKYISRIHKEQLGS